MIHDGVQFLRQNVEFISNLGKRLAEFFTIVLASTVSLPIQILSSLFSMLLFLSALYYLLR